MKTYYLYYNNSIFKVKKTDTDDGIGTITVNYSDVYVECSIDVPSWMQINLSSNYIKVGQFGVANIIKGRMWHQKGYGKVWELLFNINDENSHSEKILYRDSTFTNSFSSFSIAYSITKFMNTIHRFVSVEDYRIYKIISDDQRYDSEDEILNISKVINLYRKYEQIDPVFPYKDQLREWIEKKLKTLIRPS